MTSAKDQDEGRFEQGEDRLGVVRGRYPHAGCHG
jgi:hypothetical protein